MKQYLKLFKLIHKLDPWAIPIALCYALTTVLLPLSVLYTTGSIISILESSPDMLSLQSLILKLVIIMFTITFLNIIFKKFHKDHAMIVNYRLQRDIMRKSLVMEFEQLENPENRVNFKKAEEGTTYSGGIHTFVNMALTGIFEMLVSLLIAGSSVFFLIKSTSSLDTPLSSFTNSIFFPVILILLILIPIFISFKMNKIGAQVQYDMFDKIADVNREMNYYYSTLLFDVEPGKTIRLYEADSLIISVIKKSTTFFIESYSKALSKIVSYQNIGQLSTTLSMGCMYILLASKAYTDSISLGSVIIIGGSLNLITSTFVKYVAQFGSMSNIVNFMQYYIDYLELPEMNNEKATFPDKEVTIEFKDVCFHYPGSDCNVLNHINITIKPGERLSIVGKNGAGKTTFVKLLTKMYKPTSGEILINGKNIQKMNDQEVIKNLSIVFQDFTLYPFTILENITLSTQSNYLRVYDALNTTQIKDKIVNMPEGLETLLKSSQSEGVSFSKGEAQKIAISRAWYKDAPVIILDEPTSALDPMSEFEIYNHFNDLIEARTALYISHRMSSSKFSDRIIVFDCGEIVEEGTHKDLMNLENGIYKNLFETQALYYKN